jgi:peptidoglycan/LPS O-acetylase OafA/YrhL
MQSLKGSRLSAEPTFFKSIQGLRGFAVLLVVASHFGLPYTQNGFIGVDIFFVLSGFLITRSMVREYLSNRAASKRQGWISFVSFYSRRARKIIPSAFIVIFVILILDTVNPRIFGDRLDIAGDATWALLFLANLNFMNQSVTYFGVPSTQSPFLHYWSLSVEEQFYFLWPVLFMSAVTLSGFTLVGKSFNWKKRLVIALTILVLASVGLFYFSLLTQNTSGYYASTGRFWEFGVGALFALVKRVELNSFLMHAKSLMFLLITLLFFILDNESFQYFTVIVVLLTGFFLSQCVSGARASRSSEVLENRSLLFAGKISYSLYLVHWPFIVYLDNNGFETGGLNFLVFFPISLILGTFLFREVESRFLKIVIPEVSKRSAARRTRYYPVNKDAMRYACAGVIIVISALNLQFGNSTPLVTSFLKPQVVEPWTPPSTYVEPTNPSVKSPVETESTTSLGEGWNEVLASSFRVTTLTAGLSPSPDQLDAERLSIWKQCLTILKDKPNCNFGSSDKSKVAYIYGDSYALALSPMVFNALASKDYRVISRIYGQCIVANVASVATQINQNCANRRTAVTSELKRVRPELLVVSSLNSAPISGTQKELFDAMVLAYKQLVDSAKHVVIIGELPFGADPRTCVDSNGGLSRCFGSATSRQDYRTLTMEAAKAAGATYLDITSWICISGKCPAVIDGVISTYDGGHMTASLSKKLAPLFQKELEDLGILP